MTIRRHPHVPAGVPQYSDYLRADSVTVPSFLNEEVWRDFGTAPLDAQRYTSQAFFDLEAQRLWPRVWQMACREEDIPTVGDAQVYDIVGKSFIVVRTAPDTFRAYYNSCPHRGRKLLTQPAHLTQFRCPFHGFRWKLDGEIDSVPCRWDFAHLDDADLTLPQARVECWGGFVFLNMDPHAAPLAEYLGVLPAHFARWQPQQRWKAVHVGKVIACNWKIAQEAFMESFHVIATHPQILEYCADANSRYDLLCANVNRNLTAFAAPSPHLGGQVTPERTQAGMLGLLGRGGGAPAAGVAPRAAVGAAVRAAFVKAYGGDWSAATDAELLDAMVYNVFPNFAPWGGLAPNIVYRWRPDGRRVDSCLMEVMILKPVPQGGPRPAAVPFRLLSAQERWADVKELPILGAVIEQDMENMPLVHEGLLASGTGRVQLADYAESRIRHFHARLDDFLGP